MIYNEMIYTDSELSIDVTQILLLHKKQRLFYSVNQDNEYLIEIVFKNAIKYQILYTDESDRDIVFAQLQLRHKGIR